MKIFIGADHGGFELKHTISSFLKAKSYEVDDMGAFEFNEDDDYPDYAFKVATAVQQDSNTLGILICRSGIGVCIAANKVKDIYSALCFTPTHAEKAREHNNANILCLDSDYGDEKTHLEIVEKFLTTEFAGWDTRHGRRVKKIIDFASKA